MCMAASQPAGGQTSTGGAAVTGAASGASMGALLGPWGAAIGAVGGAAMGVIGSQAANKNAKQVEEARRIEAENQIMETRRRATGDYLDQTRLEREQQWQEESAVALKGSDVAKETRRSVATGTASAAERGVAGRTIDAISSDYAFMENEEVGRLKANQARANRQHDEAIRGYATQSGYRIADARPYVKRAVSPVDYFSPVFQAVGQLGQLKMGLDAANAKTTPAKS